jgi:ATP-binding cassette subfamily F protein 3
VIILDQITVDFGTQLLFKDISFIINKRDKIGLVGKNGAGKSTLFKLIVGEQRPSAGSVSVPQGIEVGYLPQFMDIENTRTLKNEVKTAFAEIEKLKESINKLTDELSHRTDYESQDYLSLADRLSEATERLSLLGADTIDVDIERCLLGLGFENADMERPTSEFSGGWRMRIEIAKLLLRKPNVLLLDEPTNHLDIVSIQWLEEFLKNYPGAVILISHDRAFLDNITNRTIELVNGQSYDYPLSYSKFVKSRQERREQQLAAYNNQQKEIEKTEQFIERFRYKASKAVQVQQKIKQLEKMERIEIDEEENSRINLRFPPAPRSGKIVVDIKNLTKQYGNNLVLKNIDLVIERGEKVAFVGKNGAGKSTLVKAIMKEIDYEGTCETGSNVNIGYYAQNQDELLDTSKTVYQTIDDIAVGEVRTKIRGILGSFLFSGDDIDKRVSVLSGGECSRLALATLLLKSYNVLILDEPTNHLDMRSKDILKQALLDFNGTLILVSHDRDFLSGLTGKIYEFRDHLVKETIGDVYDFLSKREIGHLNELDTQTGKDKSVLDNGQANKADNKQAYEQRKKRNNQIKKLGKDIQNCENRIAELEVEMERMNKELSENSGVASDEGFFTKYQEIEKQLTENMSKWEKLHVEYDALNRDINPI